MSGRMTLNKRVPPEQRKLMSLDWTTSIPPTIAGSGKLFGMKSEAAIPLGWR